MSNNFSENHKIEIGDVLQTEITGYTHDGRGVARVGGRVIFVPGVLVGEQAELLITAEQKKIFSARLLKVLQPAPERTEPICPAYHSCGGCHLQHMTYNEELRFKQGQVESALKRLGSLHDLPMQPIIAAEQQFHYRNKGVFHVARQGEQVRLVFWDENSHQPAADTCKLLFPPAINSLTEWLAEQNLPQNIIDVMVRYAPGSGDLLLSFKLDDENIQAVSPLLYQAAEEFAQLKVLACQTPKGWHNLSAASQIKDSLGNTDYLISAPAFFQVNNAQTLKLLQTVAGLFCGNEQLLLDAYCGIGTLGLYLAKNLPHLRQLVGIEINTSAVHDATANAAANNISNAEFTCGAAEKIFGKIVQCYQRPDVAIIDPPRRGCHQALLSGLLDLAPDKIIYVSCNPATLARDLNILCAEKYRPTYIQPVDMFPRTHHVETVALLCRI